MSRRLPVVLGEIVGPDDVAVVPCLVRDWTGRRARLRVAHAASVPDVFVLALRDREAVPCRVAWRSLAEVGVTHSGPDPATG